MEATVSSAMAIPRPVLSEAVRRVLRAKGSYYIKQERLAHADAGNLDRKAVDRILESCPAAARRGWYSRIVPPTRLYSMALLEDAR